MGSVYENCQELSVLFEKKKMNERLTAEEKMLIVRYRKASMLSALINPEITDLSLESYVPPVIELELCYATVSGGQIPDSSLTITDVMRQAFYGLNRLREILSYFEGVGTCKRSSNLM